MENIPDISLVIPCYNEEEVITSTAVDLVKALEAQDINFELVLVDNGSVDSTAQKIDNLIADGYPIVKETIVVNQGYGNGILCGIKASRGKRVCMSCADGQVEAEEVAKACRVALQVKENKLVKVRRRFRMDGFDRKFVSIFYNILINIIFGGLNSIDINGGPKIIPKECLDLMQLQSKD